MKQLFSIALEVQNYLKKQQLEFCFIGGLAIQIWGEPRLTRDVDLTIYTGFKDDAQVVDSLIKEFTPRINEAKNHALLYRVLLLKKEDVGIDISLGGLPFEQLLIKRAIDIPFSTNISLKICSAEDLVILKAFAARERDWADLETVIIRQKNKLDWDYIFNELTPLANLKEEPEILDRLIKLKKNIKT
jgi:predicted nucleotidyltransferase